MTNELSLDLTGCTVTHAEWLPRGLRLTLGGGTTAGRDVNGVRLTFEEVVNRDPLHSFLTARLTYRRRSFPWPTGGRRMIGEYLYDSRPLKLPARLTQLRRSRAARHSYPDRVFATYHGAPPAADRNRQVYLLHLSEPRFRGRGPFPIVCGRVALVTADGTAIGGGETPPAEPFPARVLTRLARRFAHAVLADDRPAAEQLLTPECARRLGRAGLKKFLPRGWESFVRHFGARESAAAMVRREMTVEVEPNPDELIGAEFVSRVPGVPPNTVRGIATVYPAPADTDVDPMCVLYFVGTGKDVRIAHAEPC